MDKLAPENYTALLQLKSTLEGMRNRGRRLRDKDPRHILHGCCERVFRIIRLGIAAFDDVEHLKEDSKPSNRDDVSLARRLHTEAFDALVALKKNSIPWSMLDAKAKEETEHFLGLYCSVAHRFFESQQLRFSHLFSIFGFYPAESNIEKVCKAAGMAQVNSAVNSTLSVLLPPSDFLNAREDVARRIEQLLVTSSHFPSNARILLFGSSRNGFGSTTSDLDMCLVMGDGAILDVKEKQSKIELMGTVLKEAGMEDVEIRSTARIPIVLFKDPVSKMDCDLSLHNALALSNTDLLLTYSCIDPRVRGLAYIIKKWSKRRHLNSPGDGTLSSYGFILCVIHYLQNIELPMLPNLQMLPPSWNGETMIDEVAKPVEFQLCVGDNTPCNTYFLRPNERQFLMLQQKAQLNKQSIAELVAGFFEYFAWKFDYRRDVVSVSADPHAMNVFRHHMKLVKAEEHAWQMHERLR